VSERAAATDVSESVSPPPSALQPATTIIPTTLAATMPARLDLTARISGLLPVREWYVV